MDKVNALKEMNMALKGNPFDKETILPQLPITGPRIKPKFEKIELGTVPPFNQISQATNENNLLQTNTTLPPALPGRSGNGATAFLICVTS